MIKLRSLSCSFCGKNETEVSKLVAGPRVYICGECVKVASRLMGSDSHGDRAPAKVEPTVWSKLSARVRQLLHASDAPRVSSPSRSLKGDTEYEIVATVYNHSTPLSSPTMASDSTSYRLAAECVSRHRGGGHAAST